MPEEQKVSDNPRLAWTACHAIVRHISFLRESPTTGGLGPRPVAAVGSQVRVSTPQRSFNGCISSSDAKVSLILRELAVHFKLIDLLLNAYTTSEPPLMSFFDLS